MDLTAERLRELLDYNPGTGEFTWLVDRQGGVKAGDRAGVDFSGGYRKIGIDGDCYQSHRLAWLFVHGNWPAGEIDHSNGQPGDNRISNLREATRLQNCRNTRRRSDNSSGRKGVSWHSGARRWRANIQFNGKRLHLGFFDTIEDAHAAYNTASKKYYGEFARVA